MRAVLSLASLLALAEFLTAQQLSTRTGAWTPEEELAGFRVPEGFVVELVASERDGVVKPVDLAFDDAGRLWTQTARMYPLDPVADIQWQDLLELMNDREKQQNHPAFRRVLDLYQGKVPGTDQVLIISGLYGGEKPLVKVWAEGLANPMSILPSGKGAYVAQGAELFFLEDSDGDGRSDTRHPLFTGFGFTDSHTMTHLLTRGPGGWVYFSHGALNKGKVRSYRSGNTMEVNYSKIGRFDLEGNRMELVAAGLNNIWGFTLREKGQWYGSEANDLGYSVVPIDPESAFPGIGNERLRPYQPFMPALHDFRVGGTGLSGLAFSEDAQGGFPAEWKDVAFLANPITSTVNSVRIHRGPDGTVRAERLPDLLSSEDDWFRPVNLKFGPDGCLYIADWYNKIISHNEVPTSHPDRDKSRGRIWRIRHVSQKPRPIPDLYRVKTPRLAEHLKSPSLWEKRAAWQQIAERKPNASLIKSLKRLLANESQDESTRIHALWALEEKGVYDASLWKQLLEHAPPDLKRESIRSLATFRLSPAAAAASLAGLAGDPDPMIRAQVLRTLCEIGEASEQGIAILVEACKPELEGNELGGPYERRVERYLARKALEQYPAALKTFLDKHPQVPALNRFWAIQALPAQARDSAFLELWPELRSETLGESDFVALCGMLSDPGIYETVRPLFEKEENARKNLQFALGNQAQVQSPALARLLQAPVMYLLGSEDAQAIELALEARLRLRVEVPREKLIALFAREPSGKMLELLIQSLGESGGKDGELFSNLVKDEKLSFDLRAAALHSLVRADSAAALPVLEAWLPSLDPEQKKTLAEILSVSPQGSGLLREAFSRETFGSDAFSLSAAERVQQSKPRDRRGQELLEAVKREEEKRRESVRKELGRYLRVAEQGGGNPARGAALFQTCLMCHQVGSQGKALGPALDGSARRDAEALLTAILDPDAAVESGYVAYRVARKDGGIFQGLLVDKNERGTTLAFMGGATVFIEASQIQSEGFLPGRSFMPKGLISSYTDQQVADLLAYIRTLE